MGGAYTKPGDAEHVITFARLLHGHSIDAIHLYAVLAGCDYKFTHVHGIGVKGAVRLIDDCGLVLEDIDRKVREKFRDAVPDDWIAQLQSGISCFTDAIVYDFEEKMQVTFSHTSGAERKSLENLQHLGKFCQGRFAFGRSLGTINPNDGTTVVLPTVDRAIRSGTAIMSRLSFDMVPGSRLTVEDAESAAFDALRFWLKTRDRVLPTGMLIADARKFIENQIKIEEIAIAKGDKITIRDPEGGSLHAVLLRREPGLRSAFPQFNPENNPPPDTSLSWETSIATIGVVAPVLQTVTLRQHYAAKLRFADATTKVIKMGYTRMVNRTRLRGFAYHGPTPGKDDLCWVRWDVPRSMNAGTYTAIVCLRFLHADPTAGLDASEVCDVVQVKCACAAGASGKCIHGAAVLWCLINLTREGEKLKYMPSTSMECAWNNPGATLSEAYSNKSPLAFMPFTKDDPDKPDKREISARSTAGARMLFDAYSEKDKKKNVRDVESRKRQRLVLYRALYGALGGSCAAERQWDTPVEQPAQPPPTPEEGEHEIDRSLIMRLGNGQWHRRGDASIDRESGEGAGETQVPGNGAPASPANAAVIAGGGGGDFGATVGA